MSEHDKELFLDICQNHNEDWDLYNSKADVKREPKDLQTRARKLGLRAGREYYSENDILLLKELYANYDGNIAEEYNRRAEVKRPKGSIVNKADELGISKWHRKAFSEEEKSYILENYSVYYTVKELWQEFCKKFGRTDIPLKTFDNKIRNFGLSRDKYGSEMPIGSVRWERDSKRIKVSNTGDHDKDWPYESHLVWIKHHGPIPDGYFIVHLDGDCTNNDISNLACVDRKVMFAVNKNNWSKKGPITEMGIKWAELYYGLKDLDQDS